MPEHHSRNLRAPSTADERIRRSHERLVNAPQPTSTEYHVRHRGSNAPRVRRALRDATDFTATQQTKLRTGDMRMARMQISMAQLRIEMERSNKLLEDLCAAAEEQQGLKN